MTLLSKIILGMSMLCLLGVGLAWYHTSVKDAGYNEAAAVYQKRIDDARTAARAEQDRITAENAIATDQLRAQLDAINSRRTREQKAADEAIKNLRRDIDSGAVRLSIASANAASRAFAAKADTSASTVARVEPEARADIAESTAQELISIASDGDSAIRQLNAVIDAYTAVQAMCSHQPETAQ